MKFKMYFFFGQYIMFYKQFNFVHLKPIAGESVRSTRENEFPFVVAITRAHFGPIVLQRDMICTASVISLYNVLTSEHCLENFETNNIHVLMGSNDLFHSQTYFPIWWITYDQWCTWKKIPIELRANDISIIGFSNKVPDGVAPVELLFIPLPTLYGKDVVAAGWGLKNNNTQTSILQTVNLIVLSNDECENRASRLNVRPVKFDKRFICSIAEPYALLISGDSGGPLLFQDKIVAITAGTCPTSQPLYHPEKINIHYGLDYYKEYILEMIN